MTIIAQDRVVTLPYTLRQAICALGKPDQPSDGYLKLYTGKFGRGD